MTIYNIQSIWNQSVVSCLVLTVASWPLYRFLRRQVRWSSISTSYCLLGDGILRELIMCMHSVMSNSVGPHRQRPTRLPRPWDSPSKDTGVGCHFLLQCMKVKSENEVAQSRPTLYNPMDCSLPGSSVHGIFQARVLEWGAIAFSKYILYIYI